jgi:hypothetical protein
MAKNNQFKQFMSFQKRNDEERIVSGIASRESLDDQGDIVSIKALEKALPDYMKWANIREMHGKSAAGTAVSAVVDGDLVRLDAHIVDDGAWKKVKADVYKGFSIGGSVIKSEQRIDKTGNPYRYITELSLSEISLVDRPAHPEAVIELWKGANMSKQELEELEEDTDLEKADGDTEEEETEEEEVEEETEEEDESEEEETEEEEDTESEDEGDEDEEEETDDDGDEEESEEDDSEDEEEEDLDEDEEEEEDEEETDDEEEEEVEQKATRASIWPSVSAI